MTTTEAFNATEWNEQGTSCPTCGSRTQRYNGWTNYETWAVKLWLDNDQGSYEYWQETTREIKESATPGQHDWETAEEMAIRELANRLEQEHADANPLGDSGVFVDLLDAALGSVNWREIAQSMLSDLA